MEDVIFTASARVLFSVRKHGDDYIFENICGALIQKPPVMNLKEAFPSEAAEKIIQACRLASSGRQDNDSFSADLGYDEPYKICLIHHDQCTSFFAAEPIIHIDNDSPRSDNISSKSLGQKIYDELCDASHDGLFMWQVWEANDFFLVYANPAFYDQVNLPSALPDRTFNELFSDKKPFIPRSQINLCIKTGRSMTFTHKCAEKTFCVSLHPIAENGHVVRVAGTSTDITEHVNKTYQLECANKQLARREQTLREQAQFEELIARTACEYMDTGYSGFSACSDKLIAELGRLLQVDWVCLWKNDDTLYGTSSDWFAEQTAKDMHLFQAQMNSGIGAWVHQFRSGKIVAINDLESEKRHQLSAFIHLAKQMHAIRSILIVPIMRGNDLWGGICVAQQYSKRVWSTIEVSRLKTAADTIMSAYLRMKKEKQLSESNKVLAEYDECLQEILDVQESLANVSRQYTVVDLDHFSSCTENMLEVLGGLTEVDLATIHVFDNECFVSYKWRKKGLPCSHLRVKSVRPDPEWMDHFRDNDHYIVGNTAEDQPALPSFLMDKMLSLGIKSFMVIPIRDNEAIRGVLVLSKILGCQNWNNTHIHTAKQFAHVFLGAYIKMCREKKLLAQNQAHCACAYESAKHADVLQKVARSAQSFFDATTDSLNDVFSEVCEEIAKLLPIQSVSLMRYYEDFTKTCILVDWASSRRLKRTGRSLIPDGDTALSIPVLYREAVWGCLLVSFASEKPSDAYINTLALMAQYCAGAYMRIYPAIQNRFSVGKEKPYRKTLSLKAQPAVI